MHFHEFKGSAPCVIMLRKGAKSVTAADPAGGLKGFLQGPKWPGVVGVTPDRKLVSGGAERSVLSGVRDEGKAEIS